MHLKTLTVKTSSRTLKPVGSRQSPLAERRVSERRADYAVGVRGLIVAQLMQPVVGGRAERREARAEKRSKHVARRFAP